MYVQFPRRLRLVLQLNVEAVHVRQLLQPGIIALEGRGVHHEVIVVAEVVHDAVVNDPAPFVADERILGLHKAKRGDIVGIKSLAKCDGVRPFGHKLAHVACVEDAHAGANSLVLLDNALFVLHGHHPPTELHHARPQVNVLLV